MTPLPLLSLLAFKRLGMCDLGVKRGESYFQLVDSIGLLARR